MMRNRNSRLSFALLIAIAMVAGACSCESDGGLDNRGPDVVVAGHPGVEKGGKYPVTFGPVQVDTVAKKIVTLENTGSAVANIARINLAKPFGSSVGADGLTIAPGAKADVEFTFAPTAERDEQVVATIAYDDGKKVEFEITGTGVIPSFTCTPETVNFGKVEVNTVGNAKVVCTNNTQLRTRLSAGRVEGTDRDSFAHTSPETGAEVAPGQPMTISLTYTANRSGQRNAHFTLFAGKTDSDPGVKVTTIRLEAESIDSALEISPSCGGDNAGLFFGYVPPGAKLQKSVIFRNIGARPLTVESVQLAAGASSAFSIKTRTPLTIPVDNPSTPDFENEVAVIVEFAPTDSTMGSQTARLSVQNSSNTPLIEACVSGFGGGPLISCVPGSLDFGQVPLGNSTQKDFVCTNAGTDILGTDDDNLMVEGFASGSPGEFAVSILNDDGTTAPRASGYGVGDTFTIQVKYTPVDEGIDNTNITVFSSDAIRPELIVSAQGEGRDLVPCVFTIVPPTLRFGIVAPGKSAQLEFGVFNEQNTECLLTNVRLSADSASAFSVDELDFLTLPPSGNVRIPVTFAPSARVGDAQVEHLGRVIFDINHDTNPHQGVDLVGASQKPCAIIDPDSLDFGTVAPRCSTKERFFSVINVCDAPIIITGIEINAGASSEFHVKNRPVIPTPASAPLRNGEQREFSMVYKPTDLGEDIGSVVITIQGNDHPYMAVLRGRGASDARQTDYFDQEDRPKVDLLWVIDDSCSMSWVQTGIATNMAAFLDFARTQQIDFQLGVTTTDVDSTGAKGRLVPYNVPATQPRHHILTRHTPDLETHWSRNVRLGTNGSASERGLEAARLALSPGLIDVLDVPTTPEINDGNLGFLRPQANLSIIFVSDEQDQSSLTPTAYYDFYRGIKGYRNDNMFAAHAIVGDPGGCPQAETGQRYIDVAVASKGIFQSICTTDWGAALKKIGTSAFGFKSRFFLSGDPERPDQIEVRKNGQRLPSVNPTTGSTIWEHVYVSDGTSAIDFGPFHVPEPGSQIEVSYVVTCRE